MKRFVISEKTYHKHIDDEVHLYGLLHQLAFMAGKVKDTEDMEQLVATARQFGEIAKQKFDVWNVPGRYLVFGDKADLAQLKETELQPLAAVLAEQEEQKAAKQKAQLSWDMSYIIPGSSFRLMVGDIFRLMVMYVTLARNITAVKTEKDFNRLRKNVNENNATLRRMYRGWGFPEDDFPMSEERLQKIIEWNHMTPIKED